MEEEEEAKGKITATFLLEYISSIKSIGSEYKGIFRSITYMNHINMTPTEEDHWCDNKVVVKQSDSSPSTLKTIQADAGAILPFHAISIVISSVIIMHTSKEALLQEGDPIANYCL